MRGARQGRLHAAPGGAAGAAVHLVPPRRRAELRPPTAAPWLKRRRPARLPDPHGSRRLLPTCRFDLTKYLAGQPLQLMMRLRSTGEYAYCLHVHHERLLARRGNKQK